LLSISPPPTLRRVEEVLDGAPQAHASPGRRLSSC